MSLSLSVCALAFGKVDSAFGLATWHQWSSRPAMERVSDIDIQSLHSALSEVLLSSQSSKDEEDICLSMTSKSASDMGIDQLLSVLADHSNVVKRKVQARRRAKKKRLRQDIEEELQFHNQMPKRRKQIANVPMDQT